MGVHWVRGPQSWVGGKSSEKISEAVDKEWKKSKGPKNKFAVKLCNQLLKMGGTHVAIPFPEEDISELFFKKGKKFSPRQIIEKKDLLNDCHGNCGRLWLKKPKGNSLVTGYGLSTDGFWRRHTWLITTKNVLIETTLKRSIYFGAVLDDVLARSFSQFYTE